MAFTIEPTKYLPMCQKEFLKNGGKIVIKKINSIEELRDFDVVVNCSGLSSSTLIGDEKVKPIRGQIARVDIIKKKMSYASTNIL